MTSANAGAGATPLSLQLYRQATRLGKPLIDHLLTRRLARAKEDGNRIEERRGVASLERPDGPLVWCHAASVGEALALLALIDKILAAHNSTHVLVTTGTVTSAALMAKRLPPRALHQFIPVDYPGYVEQFLDHWNPDLALWMESELWPNLLGQTRARRIPIALINARMSDESFKRWRRAARTAASLLESFEKCLAQDEVSAERLRALGAGQVVTTGNLKFAAPALEVNEQDRIALEQSMGGRPAWLAASTHPGEETLIAQVHDDLKAHLPDLLTTIVPRHPERGTELNQELSEAGRSIALRSRGELIEPETDIYLADTLGELGLFYRLNEVTFIGGSLVNHGGQNPLEPARLGSAIVYGPHVHNFAQIYREMDSAGACLKIDNSKQLGEAVLALMTSKDKRHTQAEQAGLFVADADSVLSRTLDQLDPYLAALAGEGSK